MVYILTYYTEINQDERLDYVNWWRGRSRQR